MCCDPCAQKCAGSCGNKDESEDEAVCRVMSLDPKTPALVSASEYRQKFELEAAALYACVEGHEGLPMNRDGQEESDDSDSEADLSDDSVG